VREFLGRVFPPVYRFGTGSIIDSAGSSSGQVDVVVEFPFAPSFPAPGTEERLYLAESVAFVIEVKSDLSRQWEQVQSKAKLLRATYRVWHGHLSFEHRAFVAELDRQMPSVSRIPFVAVGYKGADNMDGLRKRMRETAEDSRPDAALVIESGCYTCPGITEREGAGAEGIFAFAVDASYFARNVLVAEPDLDRYLSSE